MVTKRSALCLQKDKGGYVYTHTTFGNYALCDSITVFAQRIQALGRNSDYKEMYCEFITAQQPVTPFFDIDCKEQDQIDIWTDAALARIKEVFEAMNLETNCIVLDASSAERGSRHIIVRLKHTVTHQPIVFATVKQLKDFIATHDFNLPGIDKGVYREGLFRTVYSDKNSETKACNPPVWAKRPFLPHPPGNRSTLTLQQIKNTLIGYVESGYALYKEVESPSGVLPNPQTGGLEPTVPLKRCLPCTPVRNKKALINAGNDELAFSIDRHVLAQCIVHDDTKSSLENIITNVFHGSDIQMPKDQLMSYKGFCPIAHRVHKSNRQYLVLRMDSLHIHCHDESCKDSSFDLSLTDYGCLSILFRDAAATPVRSTFAALASDEAAKVQHMIDHSDPWLACELLNYQENVKFDTEFYVCEDGFWCCIPCDVFLGRIAEALKLFIAARKPFIRKVNRKDNTKVDSKEVAAFIRKISDFSFPKAVLKALKSNCYYANFKDILNSNRDLLAFENGVYDLHRDVFRPVQREDYICDRLNFNYDANVYDESAIKFIDAVLPNKELKDYVLSLISLALRSKMRDEVMLFFLGSGANGKSSFINYLMSTFPSVATVANSSVFAPRSSLNKNKPEPELAALSKQRLVFVPEMAQGQYLSGERIKLLTGGDYVAFRQLYKGTEIEQFSQLFCIALNSFPRIIGADRAVWRRIRIIDFNAKFVQHPKHIDELKRDPEVNNHIATNIRWFQTLVNVLLSYKPDSQLTIPQSIQERNHLYLKASLQFENFIDGVLKENRTAVTSAADVTDAYLQYTDDINKSRERFKLIRKANDYIMMKYKTAKYGVFYASDEKKTKRGFKGLELISFVDPDSQKK